MMPRGPSPQLSGANLRGHIEPLLRVMQGHLCQREKAAAQTFAPHALTHRSSSSDLEVVMT